MKNRILSIFAAIAVILSLSACQNGNTEQTAPLSEAVVSETTQSLETTIQSEIEQTSNLTFEDINIIEINGKQVSLPFKVEDLGDGYSLGELQGYKEKVSAIFYNEQVVAVVDLDNEVSFKLDGLPRKLSVDVSNFISNVARAILDARDANDGFLFYTKRISDSVGDEVADN